MNNIKSIALKVITDNGVQTLFKLQQAAGFSEEFVQGVIIAGERALFIKNIINYRWSMTYVNNVKLTDQDILKLKSKNQRINVRNIKNIKDSMMIKAKYRPQYIIWINNNDRYIQYTFSTNKSVVEFMQGALTVTNAFLVNINEVISGQIIRLKIFDDQYIVTFFNLDNVILPSYDFTAEELADNYNIIAINKTLDDRVANIKDYIIVDDNFDQRLKDIKEIFRYTLDVTDYDIVHAYNNIKHTGYRSVQEFLTMLDLI